MKVKRQELRNTSRKNVKTSFNEKKDTRNGRVEKFNTKIGGGGWITLCGGGGFNSWPIVV